MHCNRMYIVVLVSFVLFTIVKGSCLEYGHSCWGAHGKRSGNGGGKLLRAAANLRTTDNDGNNAAQNAKTLFDTIDELNVPPENKASPHNNNDEEQLDGRSPGSLQDTSRLRTLLRKQNARLRNRNRNFGNEDSMEQEERFIERWRKLPLYNLKPLTKSQLTNSENDLLQQPGKIFLADENLYYDFQ